MLEATIKDIYTPDVIGIAPDARVSEAVALMRRNGISCIVVLRGKKPIGIFTERNIVLLSLQGNDFLDRPVREVMTSPVLTASESMPVHEAYNLLVSSAIRHLVVVDGKGDILGVVTQSNMIQNLGFEYFVEMKLVTQIMTRSTFMLPPEASVQQAVNEMARMSYSCVVVARDRRPVGMLTERDVTKLVLDRADLGAMRLGQVMSSPVFVVERGVSVHYAASIMRERGVRRLVVVDDAGLIAGLITQTNIVRGLESRYVEILRRVISDKNDELREARSDLDRKSVYLDNILNSSLDVGIVATDIDRRVNYFNAVAERILGVRPESVLGRSVMEIHLGDGWQAGNIEDALARIAAGGDYTFSFERQAAEGTISVDARVSGIRDNGDALVGFVLTLHDVTERKQTERIIRHLAYHDSLTGLPNRALVKDRLGRAMASAKRNGRVLALLMLDLDRFKQVNDTLGHSVGDRLLQEVAARLSSLLRAMDTVARMGGDEFLVILPEIAYPHDACVVADKILQAVEKPYCLEGTVVHVTTSIGIAAYPMNGEDIDTLMLKADSAMYRAKESGRNSYWIGS